MKEVVNVGKSLERYTEIINTMDAMHEKGHPDEDIAKSLNLSLIDMRILRKLIVKATNAILRLDTFNAYISHGEFGGMINAATIAKAAKELGMPEASVLRRMKEIAKLHMNLDL